MELHFFIIFAIQLAGVYGYNYCHNVEMCPIEQAPHFLCTLGDELKPYRGAVYIAAFPETIELKRLFVDTHNEFRNLLAEGHLNADGKPYKAATRLRELIWDTELAYTAKVHASFVCFQHTKCRSTKRFPYAGENMGYKVSSKKIGLKEIVNTTIGLMFDEYKLSPDPADLIATCDTKKHVGTGHFTVMANDRVSRLGCGVAVADNCSTVNAKSFCYFVTCHYDFTNAIGNRIYREGEPASACGDWNTVQSKRYEYLCEPNGQIFPFEQ